MKSAKIIAGLSLVLLLACGGFFSVFSEGGPTPPNLIVDISERPVLLAGTMATLDIPLKNISPAIAYDVRVTIANDINSLPFSLEQFVPSVYTYRITVNQSATLRFQVFIPEDIKPQLFELRLDISYTDSVGQSYSKSEICYFLIENPDYENPAAKDYFDVEYLKLPETVLPGEKFSVTAGFRNLTAEKLNNLTATLSFDSGFLLDNDSAQKTVSIDKDGSASVTYRLIAGGDVASGLHVISVSGKYGKGAEPLQEKKLETAVSVPKDASLLIRPDLEITEMTFPESVKASESFTVRITMKNTGDVAFQGTTLTLEKIDVLLNKTPLTQTGGLLEPGQSVTKEYTFLCREDAPEGYLPCEIAAVAFYEADGEQKLLGKSYYGGTYVNEQVKASPRYTLTLGALPEKVLADSGDFTLKVTLRLDGAKDKNVQLSLELPFGIINKTPVLFHLGELEPGAEITKEITLSATASAESGYHPIKVAVTSDSGNAYSQYTGVLVENEKADQERPADIPVIIIKRYSFGDDPVLGGTTFPLELEFYNTSATAAAKDLKITLSSDEPGVYTPAASSNTFFVSSLGAGQSIVWKVDLQVKSDILPKSYGVSLSIDYRNEQGTSAPGEKETISIPVSQEMRFNISDIPALRDITLNEDAILTLNCANLGKSTIYNVMIKVEGDFSSSEYEIFAGNLEAGKGFSRDLYLMPYAEGYTEGTLTWRYEDSDGNLYTEEQLFGFHVFSSDTGAFEPFPPDGGFFPDGEGEPGMEDGKKGFFLSIYSVFSKDAQKAPVWFILLVILIPVAIVVTVVTVIVKRRRRRIEAEDEDN